jgi:hypothetical protein
MPRLPGKFTEKSTMDYTKDLHTTAGIDYMKACSVFWNMYIAM